MTIRLEPAARGTRLHLVHDFADAAVRDQHVQGWRYQLSLFANVVAERDPRRRGALVDAWFAAWAEPRRDARDPRWRRIAFADVSDARSVQLGRGHRRAEPHISAAQRYMPGLRLQRDGDARHCQGRDRRLDGGGAGRSPRGQGTNVFTLGRRQVES